jgi:hypothetical protein
MPIKTFVSSGFYNRYILRLAIEHLKSKYPELNIISEWIYSNDDAKNLNFKTNVGNDITGVERCELFLAFYPWGSGSKCETMYALAKRKNIIVLIDKLVLPDDLNKLDYNKWSDFFPLIGLTHIKDELDISKLNLSNFRIFVTEINLYEKCLSHFVQLYKEKPRVKYYGIL